jgi:G:T/U-mismatch repair DNA glycosylase
MDDAQVLEQIRRLSVWSGHRQMTVEDIARIQPGLARMMPEVGDRTWKLYYAAKATNWPLATFQAKEIRGLMDLCGFTRPQHEEALRQFVEKNWQPVQDALEQKDLAAFEEAFHKSIKAANAYHKLKGKPYLIWKLPDSPPADLELRPQDEA